MYYLYTLKIILLKFIHLLNIYLFIFRTYEFKQSIQDKIQGWIFQTVAVNFFEENQVY